MRKKIAIGIGCGAIAVLVSWLLFGETSPMVTGFAPNDVPLSKFWANLHFHLGFIVYVVGFRITQGGYFELYSLIFVQWFLIGLAAGYLLQRRRFSGPLH